MQEAGSKYILCFINDYSRFTWTYILAHKLDALSSFKAFSAQVETEFSNPIQKLPTDQDGGKLTSLSSTVKPSGVNIKMGWPQGRTKR